MYNKLCNKYEQYEQVEQTQAQEAHETQGFIPRFGHPTKEYLHPRCCGLPTKSTTLLFDHKDRKDKSTKEAHKEHAHKEQGEYKLSGTSPHKKGRGTRQPSRLGARSSKSNKSSGDASQATELKNQEREDVDRSFSSCLTQSLKQGSGFEHKREGESMSKCLSFE